MCMQKKNEHIRTSEKLDSVSGSFVARLSSKLMNALTAGFMSTLCRDVYV